MLRSMKRDLRGFTVGATDGDIGKVEEVYFDDQSFTVRHLVVDTGGWLAERKVLISPMALLDIDWGGKRIKAALTKAQVEKSPAISTDRPVSRQHELEYYSYYGYPSYWAGPYLWGAYAYPLPLSGPATSLEKERRWDWAGAGDDPHLRSSAAVTGYHIAATDGDIGHVEDFIVDDVTWMIRYMVVDTRNWWPGRKVLVSPEWIERLDWSDAKVHVGVTRAQIKQSPEYDPLDPVAREYEARLHDHYGLPSYWSDRRDERIMR
jgi:sporulation protein YlmC with PRC-barrel domain